MYKLYNCNPKNKKTGDCVIRAFTLASGKTWEQTLTDLFEIALKEKSVPNDISVYTKYADKLNFKKRKVELVNRKKPTVKSFCETHKTGTYVLRVAHHVVTVKDGFYHDIWDCGSKSVYLYWEV
jgi:hypothetical protein